MAPRCDRCGAAALWLVVLQSAHSLAFCGHHHNQHRVALDSLNAVIVPVPEEVNA